jgi:hypothetical protein
MPFNPYLDRAVVTDRVLEIIKSIEKVDASIVTLSLFPLPF